MSDARKIVLVSTRGYDPSHDELLRNLIARQILLFCVVGIDCALWEDVMDELVVGPTGDGAWRITTSSHPGETVAEVVEFANGWLCDEPTSVQVIEV